MPTEFVCKHCGKPFSRPKSAKAKYCSLECRDTAYRIAAEHNGTRLTINCIVCGKPFTDKKSTIEKGRKCCSRECRYKQSGKSISKALSGRVLKRETRICPHCGIEFEVPPSNHKRFCSRECANNSLEKSAGCRERAIAQWDNPDTRKILEDGIRRRSESEEWRSAPHFQAGENHPRYKGGNKSKRTKEMARYEYKQWRTSVFTRDSYRCRDCGVHTRHLIAHHIKHWSEYPELRYDIDNGITLCESCHDKRHGWIRHPKTYHCTVCGKPKSDGQRPRCRSCANKQRFSAE